MNNRKCRSCNNDLLWGQFAYGQTLCWDCFVKSVRKIARETKNPEEASIVNHLLKVMAQTYGYKL